MPAPVLTPASAVDEMFPADVGAEALELAPLDVTAVPRAFEPYALTVAIKTSPASYVRAGIVAPIEVIVAAPSGRHERQELTGLPVAVVVTPIEAGTHRVPVREISHPRWWGGINVVAEGERIR